MKHEFYHFNKIKFKDQLIEVHINILHVSNGVIDFCNFFYNLHGMIVRSYYCFSSIKYPYSNKCVKFKANQMPYWPFSHLTLV